MSVNSAFVIKHGIQVNSDLIVASNNAFRVVANTLHVNTSVFTVTTATVRFGANAIFANTTRVGLFTGTPSVALDVGGTDGIKFPAGNTSQRPGAVANGVLRYNNELNQFEGYSNSAWGPIAGGGGSMYLLRQGWTANSTVNNNFVVTGSYIPDQIDVYCNGIRQVAGDDVNVSSGTNIVFSTNTELGDSIYVIGTANAVGASNTSSYTSQQFTANSTVNTSFTITSGYTPGVIQVFLNGLKLLNGVDVDVSSGTTIDLISPAAIGDRVDVFGIQGFNISTAFPQGGGTIIGSLTVNGLTTLNTASANSLTVVNGISGNSVAALGNTTVSGFLNVSSTFAAGNTTVNGSIVASGTLAAGNTTVTGFINVSSTAQIGNNLTVAGTITGRSFTGNAVFLTNTEIQAGNSTQNSIITSTRVTVGNSTVNTYLSSSENRLSGNTTVDSLNYTVTDKGTVNGTVVFTANNDVYQKAQLNGAATIQFGGFPPANTLGMIFIEAINWGNVVVTFANTVNWSQGNGSYTTVFSNSGVTLANTGTNWVTVWSTDGGTTRWGTAV